jgi:hypothetical protein
MTKRPLPKAERACDAGISLPRKLRDAYRQECRRRGTTLSKVVLKLLEEHFLKAAALFALFMP